MHTEKKLPHIHRHFYHPEADRLFTLLKRANPYAVSLDVYSNLEKIKGTCDMCQQEADARHRFRVSLPQNDCIFNKVVSLDLMSLDKRTVLHIVYCDTKFGAACFLLRESAKDVWEAFYPSEYPNTLVTQREWPLRKDPNLGAAYGQAFCKLLKLSLSRLVLKAITPLEVDKGTTRTYIACLTRSAQIQPNIG